MTLTEKIIARHADVASVAPGQNVWVNVDVLMTHDVCGPGTIGIFKEQFGPDAKVFDPDKVVLIPDHYIFTADEKAHRNVETVRQFAAQQHIRHIYDADFVTGAGLPTGYGPGYKGPYHGVCHATLAEKGHCKPAQLMFGTDSHTCTAGAFGMFATGIGNTEAAFVLGTGKLWLKVPPTMRFVFDGAMPDHLMAKDLILTVIGDIGVDGATYRAMEFAGSAVAVMGMEERMTLCNMAIEAGGKNGIIAADEVTEAYLAARNVTGYQKLAGDADAEFLAVRKYKVDHIQPTVARPHSPANKALARDLGDEKIDQAYLGSCTGGKLDDMIAAAGVLAGRTVAVDTFVVPATVTVDRALDEETINGKTLREIFLHAGCKVGPPSCAACLGGPPDTFGRMNEPKVCISSTNRNFPGRMGHPRSAVFLASPLTVAASAVKGRITDPRDVMQ